MAISSNGLVGMVGWLRVYYFNVSLKYMARILHCIEIEKTKTKTLELKKNHFNDGYLRIEAKSQNTVALRN